MDSSGTKIKWQLPVVLVVLFILILLAIFLPNIINPVQRSSSPSPNATSGATVKTGWRLQKQSDYSLQVPLDFVASSETEEEFGDEGIETLSIRNPKALNYKLDFMSVPEEHISVEKTASIFRSYGYKESKTLVDSLPAEEFIGTLNTKDGTLQQIAVVFKRGNEVHKLQLSYEATERDKDFDDQFFEILPTIHFSP